MNELKSILSILSSPHLREDPTLEKIELVKGSLLAKLYTNTKKNNYLSDEDAARDIYGESLDMHAFHQLKSKLRQRALNTLLLRDIITEELNPRKTRKHRLFRSYIEANLLMEFGARNIANKIIEKCAKEAREYYLYDVDLVCTEFMRTHYWFTDEKKKFEMANSHLKTITEILRQEYRAQELYQRCVIPHVSSLAKRPDLLKMISLSLKEIRSLSFYKDSFVIPSHYFQLRLVYLDQKGDFEQISSECKEALKFLRKKKALAPNSLIGSVLVSDCEAYIFQRKYVNALGLLGEMRNSISAESFNRLIVERFGFLAYLNIPDLRNAQKLIKDILSSKLYSKSRPMQKEEWMLLDGYMNLREALEQKNRGTHLAPISHSLPLRSKDKLGSNITIVLYECMRALVQRNFEEILRCDKGLDNYLYRYLNGKPGYKRTIYFMKMLRILVKEDFDLVKVKKKTDRFLKLLQIRDAKNVLEPIEIIPYEELWELLIHQ
ncbi:MAG TPA: hypothetical protein VIX80_03085 [Candidatus Kapabacteria bacterium]